MTVRFQLQRLLSLSIASTSFAVFATAPPHALAQAQVRQNPSQKTAAEQPPRERQPTKTTSERADDETPSLGILAGSCPGKAVCVKGTFPDSPAQEAGIVPGDCILSVDRQEVTSPVALKNLIAKMSPDAQVTLKVWRQGEEMERKVQLASKADQLPKCHDAWLGVMLTTVRNSIRSKRGCLLVLRLNQTAIPNCFNLSKRKYKCHKISSTKVTILLAKLCQTSFHTQVNP